MDGEKDMKKELLWFVLENILLFFICYFTMDFHYLKVIDYFVLTLIAAYWLMFAFRFSKLRKQ